MSIDLVMLSNHPILCFPFSFCLQSFPPSGSFPMSWHFTSSSQNIGASNILIYYILNHKKDNANNNAWLSHYIFLFSSSDLWGLESAVIPMWTNVQRPQNCSQIFLYIITFKSCIWDKAMAPHSSTLAWKIPWTEEHGRLQSMGLLRVRHNWATSFSLFTFMHWRRKWQPTPVLLHGESQGWGSLVGCHLWCHTESDTTEVT